MTVESFKDKMWGFTLPTLWGLIVAGFVAGGMFIATKDGILQQIRDSEQRSGERISQVTHRQDLVELKIDAKLNSIDTRLLNIETKLTQ